MPEDYDPTFRVAIFMESLLWLLLIAVHVLGFFLFYAAFRWSVSSSVIVMVTIFASILYTVSKVK